MARYIFKRILLMIPVLLGITFVIFTIMSLSPGDPILIIMGEDVDEETHAAMEKEMGLDKPFIVQYFNYVFKAVQGDFGNSWIKKIPVFDEILARFPTTFWLTLGAICLKVLIGVPIGVVSAVKQYSVVDNVSMICALLFASMPTFWLGLILILVFSLYVPVLPAVGAEHWQNFVLPCCTIAIGSAATMVRMTRSAMLEVIRQDYIRTARAKGVAKRRIIFGHAMKNSLIPVITYFGPMLAYIVTGSLVVERIFAVPGIGRAFVSSITNRDYPMVMGTTIVLAVLIVVMNLVSDIMYKIVDPRINLE
jgi:peptide/nickel transport system permease protein